MQAQTIRRSKKKNKIEGESIGLAREESGPESDTNGLEQSRQEIHGSTNLQQSNASKTSRARVERTRCRTVCKTIGIDAKESAEVFASERRSLLLVSVRFLEENRRFLYLFIAFFPLTENSILFCKSGISSFEVPLYALSRVRCPNNDGEFIDDLVGFVARLFHSRLKGFLCSANLQTLLFQTRYPRPFSDVPSRRYERSPVEMSLRRY